MSKSTSTNIVLRSALRVHNRTTNVPHALSACVRPECASHENVCAGVFHMAWEDRCCLEVVVDLTRNGVLVGDPPIPDQAWRRLRNAYPTALYKSDSADRPAIPIREEDIAWTDTPTPSHPHKGYWTLRYRPRSTTMGARIMVRVGAVDTVTTKNFHVRTNPSEWLAIENVDGGDAMTLDFFVDSMTSLLAGKVPMPAAWYLTPPHKHTYKRTAYLQMVTTRHGREFLKVWAACRLPGDIRFGSQVESLARRARNQILVESPLPSRPRVFIGVVNKAPCVPTSVLPPTAPDSLKRTRLAMVDGVDPTSCENVGEIESPLKRSMAEQDHGVEKGQAIVPILPLPAPACTVPRSPSIPPLPAPACMSSHSPSIPPLADVLDASDLDTVPWEILEEALEFSIRHIRADTVELPPIV